MIVNAAQVLNNNQFISSTGQIVQGHIIQGPDNTVQMITAPSGTTQLLQLRSTNDRCELIVQPTDMGKFINVFIFSLKSFNQYFCAYTVSMVMQSQETSSGCPEIEADDNNEEIEGEIEKYNNN